MFEDYLWGRFDINNILNLSLAYLIWKFKGAKHYVTCTDTFCFYMKAHAFKTMFFFLNRKKKMKNEIKILSTGLWFAINLCKQNKTVFAIISSRKSD